MHQPLREASGYSSTSDKDVVVSHWSQRLLKASVLGEHSHLWLCTDWSRFHCARKFLLCSSVNHAIANRRVKIRKFLSNISRNTTPKQSNAFGERSRGVEEQTSQHVTEGKCWCVPGGWWWSYQPWTCLAFGLCLLRILLIRFSRTANSMQTALTGSGKGKTIWPCSLTAKFHCRRERDSCLLKLR